MIDTLFRISLHQRAITSAFCHSYQMRGMVGTYKTPCHASLFD